MKNFQVLAILMLAITFSACGGSHHVGVTASPATMALDQGQATTITATVTHDSTNAGVTFALSCSAASCGTLSATSATTAPYTVTYTAPSPVTSALQVTVTTKSAKDSTKTAASVITVNPNPAIAAPTPAQLAATMNTAYSLSLGSGGSAPFTWQITSGTLPAGLTLNTSANTGAAVITGKPTALGTSTITLKVTDSAGGGAMSATSQPMSIVVSPAPLTIATTSLPNGVLNTSYSQALQAAGGTTPYHWSLVSGSSLPAGLSITGSGTNWAISGTPTATGTTTFSLQVTDSSTPPLTATTPLPTSPQALSITITTAAAACGSGHESALTGEYAFSLSGYNSTGFLAAIGSFHANGSGGFLSGTVDSNGTLGVQANKSITLAGSSYTIGADNRGCATIVTPFYTFTTRFALESTGSNAATQGTLEEWEPGPTPYIASGEILKQTSIPSALPTGTWVYKQYGVYSGERLGVVGTIHAAGSGQFDIGEYDSNVAGTNASHTGLAGTYTTPDSTTGRYEATTELNNLASTSTTRAEYLVSNAQGVQFLELVTAAPIVAPTILVGKGVPQSGSLTVSNNLVFYATGVISGQGSTVQFGRATVSGTSYTANIYEDNAGVWSNPDPNSVTCNYSIDSYGKVTTSGANCGTYAPVLYLTGPSAGFILGTDPAVSIGDVASQTVTTVTPATYFSGTMEAISQSINETEVGSITISGNSSNSVVTGNGDQTSFSSPQRPNQPISSTFTVNSDGTIIDSSGQPIGIVIVPNRAVIVDGQGQTYPSILVLKSNAG